MDEHHKSGGDGNMLAISIILASVILSGSFLYAMGGVSSQLDKLSTKVGEIELSVAGGSGSGSGSGAVVAQPTVAPQPLPTTNGQVSVAGKPIRGAANAKVTIVAFEDFECPFCGRAHTTIQQILKDYDGKVNFVIKHFPLSFHPNAVKAGEAYECSLDQSTDKAFALEDWMFGNQQALTVTDLKAAAKSVGLDTAKFNTCLDSGSKKGIVDKDQAEGAAAGVGGTPTFFIGPRTGDTVKGQELVGAQPISAFKQVIDAALAA